MPALLARPFNATQLLTKLGASDRRLISISAVVGLITLWHMAAACTYDASVPVHADPFLDP